MSGFFNMFKILKFRLILIVFISLNLNAQTFNTEYKFKDYDEAEKSKDFLKFIGESTKFKIITTKFDGYARNFSFSYDLKNKNINNIKIIIKSSELDTDNSSRNEKMRDLCLRSTEFPEIIAWSDESIEIKDQKDATMNIKLKIKDKEITRPLIYSLLKEETGIRVNLKADFSFVEANIADPSIAIARVHELFIIEGSLFLKGL